MFNYKEQLKFIPLFYMVKRLIFNRNFTNATKINRIYSKIN